MLMSAVLDPLAFEKENFENPIYYLQAKEFLRRLQENGILILDPDGKLKNKLLDIVEKLPTKFGQEIGILTVEILKTKKRTVSCLHSPTFINNNLSFPELALMVRTQCGADAVITNEKGKVELINKGTHAPNIVTLDLYLESEFEKKRKKFFVDMPNMDNLETGEFDDVIIRIVKFSKWLRFYDQYIGKGANTMHFRKGIEYILELWKRHGHFASQKGLIVDIIAGDVISTHRPLTVN